MRTQLLDFTRDDGSAAVIEYTRTRYYGAVGPSWNDPGSPAEGGEIEHFAATDADGAAVELTEAETERAEAEIYELSPEDDYDPEDFL